MRIVGQVPKISRADPALFDRDYVRRGRPVVLTDMIEDWPARTTWTPTRLVSKLGDATFRFKRSSSNAHPDFRRPELREMFATEEMPFSAFLDRITTGPIEERSRLLFTGDEHFILRVRDGVESRNDALGPLLEDIVLPPIVPASRLYSIWGWFSGPNVRTWLHYDNNGCHNLNAQVAGHKRAWLIDPEQIERCALFPEGGVNPATNCSQIDVEHPDLERFPHFHELEAWEAELHAGDLLFIPANWLHTFHHDGSFNANINFWWKPDSGDSFFALPLGEGSAPRP